MVAKWIITSDFMSNFICRWYHHWNELMRERRFRISFLVGIALMLFSMIINYYATLYTSNIVALTVGDVILEHLPKIDPDLFLILIISYVYGIKIIAAVIFIYPTFFRPELFPFTAKTVSAFIILRSAFISMTHLGAPEGLMIMPHLSDKYTFLDFFHVNDLFFSGHTALPFLGALLFWEHKSLRYFLLVMSFIMGATVLLMRIHYSIDVFSAYFITYTIFIVSDRIFNKLNAKFKKIVERIEFKLKIRQRMMAKIEAMRRFKKAI